MAGSSGCFPILKTYVYSKNGGQFEELLRWQNLLALRRHLWTSSWHSSWKLNEKNCSASLDESEVPRILLRLHPRWIQLTWYTPMDLLFVSMKTWVACVSWLVVRFFLYPRNSGQDPWPEGTELKLVSGKALGFESIELDAPAWTPDPWIHKKTRKPTKMES